MSNAKCTNERLGRKLFRLAFLPTGPGDLDPDLQRHVAECPSCIVNFAEWKKKGYFAARLIEARAIVSRAQSGDTDVRVRSLGRKTAYFSPARTGDDVGVMVVTDETGSVIQIDDLTRDDFLTASPGE
jgi:hypothetical protein